MGDTIIILSPEWAKLKYSSKAEKPGIGLIARVEFSYGDDNSCKTKIRIIGAYFPSTSSTGKGTLMSRLAGYLGTIG
jgi:hypothetical protein